jgi:hypothetical protein
VVLGGYFGGMERACATPRFTHAASEPSVVVPSGAT